MGKCLRCFLKQQIPGMYLLSLYVDQDTHNHMELGQMHTPVSQYRLLG